VQVEAGRRVLFLPNFMFGAPQSVLDTLYGGPGGIPTIGAWRLQQGAILPGAGMMADSTGGDRVIIQTFMNLVIVTVVLLLWANNRPAQKKEE
jgi:hypothetical protein